MKRYFLILLMLISTISVYSQNSIFNTNVGVSIGYSHVYNDKLDSDLTPRDLISFDLNVYGAYIGFAYGEQTLYRDCSYYDCYSEKLNTYIFRVGPSFRLGNYNAAFIVTPYIGLYMNSYSEDIDEYRYNYSNCYCDYCTRYNYGINYCLYEDTYNYELLYGVKASLNINIFEIGAHVSNKEFGISVGISMNMD